MKQTSVLQILQRNVLLILVVTAIVFAASLAFARRAPASVFGSVSVTVHASRGYETVGEKFIIQANPSVDLETAVATTQSWVTDPALVKGVFEKAGVAPTDSSLKGLAKQFKLIVDIAGSSTYQIQYSATTVADAEKVFLGLNEAIGARAKQFSTNGELVVSVDSSSPVFSDKSSTLPITPIAGLVVGFIFAVTLSSLVERRKD